MLSLNLSEVQQFLTSKNYNVQLQKETNQLYILLKIEEREFPLFIRIYEESDLLQLILFIPVVIQAGTENDLARLLHTLNKEIDVPGFGMDENSKIVFYRIMIPAFKKKLESELVETFMKSLPLVAESFAPVIMTAAAGNATYAQIMKKMEELQRSQQ